MTEDTPNWILLNDGRQFEGAPGGGLGAEILPGSELWRDPTPFLAKR